MEEQRRSTRQKSFLRGCVYFEGRTKSTDCIILDLSSEGARIVISEFVNISDTVELHIPQKGRTVPARVTWRQGCKVGLALSEVLAPSAVTSSNELAQRVSQLETEISLLWRELKRIAKVETNSDSDAA